ncbi:MAG: endo-1,4-beta-xylanase [Opitutales bacterium]|nr:endo-1,4-beta-xylanase [Opitutales bacterium]
MRNSNSHAVVFALALPAMVAASEPAAPHESLMHASSLHHAYADAFPVGTAVPRDFLTDRAYAPRLDVIRRHFDHVVAENEMKWERLQPEEGVFTFEEADRLVDWAEANGLRVWGHTLLWHNQVPDWVFEGPDGGEAPPALLRERLHTHIETVMGHFRGRVYGWDVLNEVLTSDPADPFRDSRWLRILGEDYMAETIRLARAADPDALLAVNDYGMSNPDKLASALHLLERLGAEEAMPDIFGMQSHMSVYWPPVEMIENSLRALAATGVRVAISEFDMSVYDWTDTADRYREALPEPLALFQADRIARVMQLYRRCAADIERVTHWGPFDDRNWKNNFPVEGRRDHAGLIDRHGRPKPAFLAFQSPGVFLAAFGPVPEWRPEEPETAPEVSVRADRPAYLRLSQLAVPPNTLVDRGRLRVSVELALAGDALEAALDVTDTRWNGRASDETVLRVYLDGKWHAFSADVPEWEASGEGERLRVRLALSPHVIEAGEIAFDLEWRAPAADPRGTYLLRWADTAYGDDAPERAGVLRLD